MRQAWGQPSVGNGGKRAVRLIHKFARQDFAALAPFGYAGGMEQDRIQQALARIEAAAARIERSARAAPVHTGPAHSAAPADADLARKHAALKREAWAALAELDTLIEAIDA